MSETKISTERVIVRMWKRGPMREMAPTKVSAAFIPYAKTINGCSFAGRYVCDACQEPCGGISLSDVGKMSGKQHSNWLCDLCIRGQARKARTSEQKQAAIDRLLAARRGRMVAQDICSDSDSCMGTTTEREDEGMSASEPVAAVAAEVNPLKEVYGIM
jgi:hypothetical protein